jgi:GntR family transcriptional regulator, transcriptional repressor for pyruvate dehydrogenase complex
MISIEPLRVTSLKEACVTHLEGMILSGELQAGERLPAERDLAVQLGVSRPVLHEALVDLAAKGLVSILPRRGVVINDYRKSGSTAILSSLLTYHQGNLDPKFERSLFEMRGLLETETARLAALHAAPEEIMRLASLLEAEQTVDRGNVAALTQLDFEFHLLVAVLSGNLVYPLILNSFKNIYTHFTQEFFRRAWQSAAIEDVFDFHQRLAQAIAARQPDSAARTMAEMLEHGAQLLQEENHARRDL